MTKPIKYIVIYELDTGYMDCVGIFDNTNEAYGKAYLALCEYLQEDNFYVTEPGYREGENGMIIHAYERETNKLLAWVTVLFYCERHGE